MRYLFLFSILFFFSHASNSKEELTIGVGSFTQTQAYVGVDSQTILSPVIFFDNELFYVRWSRAGVYFLGNKTDDFAWAVSLTVQPRVYGYKDSDIQGMEKRENTFEGGLAFSLKKKNTYLEVILLNDLLHKHDSWVVKTEIGHDFEIGEFLIYPSFIAEYQSRNFLNYYYGVSKSEAQKRGENTYAPESGFQLGMQTFIKYPLTKKLSVLVNLRADKLPSSVYSSTIVEDKYIYSGLASLIYTFEY